MKKITKRKTLFSLILILLTLIVLELISIPIFYSINGNTMSKDKLFDNPLFTSENSNEVDVSPFELARKFFKEDVLHPYLGFVKDYDLQKVIYKDQLLTPINNYGFMGDFPTNPNSFKVGVFGGSVAQELFLYSKNTLINELQKSEALQNQQIEVASLALGGMKQPQQLMTLNYFLSLGIQFDMVINLDGFNEIVLPYCENIPHGTSPSYPRAYRAYATKTFSKDILYLISEITRSEGNRIKYGRRFLSSPLKYSHLALTVYLLLDQGEEKKLLELNQEMDQYFTQENANRVSAQERGPKFNYQDANEIFSASTELWSNTSKLMQQICKENNLSYYHFLQPNQYVKLSKQFTDWEMKHAIHQSGYCYRQAVENGYSSLIETGQELLNQGVNFHDLTNIYQDIPSDIYKDNCCHYNQEGNDILAKKIAQIISTNLNK